MKFNKIIFGALAIAALSSCDTEDTLLENHLFIDASTFNNEVRVALDEGVNELSREVRVAMAFPQENEVKVSFAKAPELLETYKQAYYSPDVELLPDEFCDLAGVEAVIRAGDITCDAVNFAFKNLQKLSLGDKEYVLPVRMSADGVDVLPRANVMYFRIKEASLVNVVADINKNCAWPEWKDFQKVNDMKTMTMECLINCHSFNNESKVHTIMGIEDHFLLRIGDVQKSPNSLHLAAGYRDVVNGSYYRRSIPEVDDPALQLKTDRWYHVAVTFDNGMVRLYLDGKEMANGDVSVLQQIPDPEHEGQMMPVGVDKCKFMVPHSNELEDQPRCFWIGYSYDHFAEGKMNRCLDGMIAEVRIWDKVLTPEEIKAPSHFYKVYPEENGKYSEHLVAYWKFDEGEGKKVRDHSQYGHDLDGFNNYIWYPVELPEKN